MAGVILPYTVDVEDVPSILSQLFAAVSALTPVPGGTIS